MKGNPLEEISRHLFKTDDPILVILRAHLLIEERLRDMLTRICRSPDELQTARLSFHQALYLCRAVIGRQGDPAWDFVARLNEVRNRIAHHLDPGDFDELLGSVIAELRRDYPGRLGTPLDRFRTAVHYACGYFDSLRGSVRLREAYDYKDEV